MLEEAAWVREYSYKLCPALREQLMTKNRLLKWLPGFLDRPLKSIRQRFDGIPVIVQLKEHHSFCTLNNDNLGGVLGCQVNHRVEMINGFATTINVNTLKKLIAHDAVCNLWYDREIKALLDTATPVVNAPQVWKSGYRGRGIGIAILDTGIHPHPDLTTPKNRIVGFKDFINWRSQPYDDNGHGTHCAGDAAGNGSQSGGRYTGPAPEAKLIGIKVLNKKGSGVMSNLLAGIQWCITNQKLYGIRILSMSLGSKAKVSYKNDLLCQTVEKVWQAGIVVCAAAGNDGPRSGTINSPGTDPKIITVGALDDKDTTRITDDAVAAFSSRGPTIDGLTKPDVIAPGARIVSLRSPNSYLDRNNRHARVGEWYLSMSGTSMATPICAGVTALILEACPRYNPVDVKRLLLAACRKINPDPNSQGAGLVDVQAAARQFPAKTPK